MRRHLLMYATTGLALLSLATLGSPAFADMMNFKATLNAASGVPPTDSKGTGEAKIAFDTASKELTWSVTFAGLSGDATAAHFHGPADATATAGPVVPIPGVASPMEGKATLTDAQAADLQAGKWYVNVHTAKYPDGEIRGQVTKAE